MKDLESFDLEGRRDYLTKVPNVQTFFFSTAWRCILRLTMVLNIVVKMEAFTWAHKLHFLIGPIISI